MFQEKKIVALEDKGVVGFRQMNLASIATHCGRVVYSFFLNWELN